MGDLTIPYVGNLDIYLEVEDYYASLVVSPNFTCGKL